MKISSRISYNPFKFFKKLIDTADTTSSKRFVGLIGAFTLFTGTLVYHTDIFVEATLILSLGALAITGVEKIFTKTSPTAVDDTQITPQ